MLYIIQILAAILIGISVAALIRTRTIFVSIGAIAAIVFAILTLYAPGWWILWAGAACFMVGQFLHRDAPAGASS